MSVKCHVILITFMLCQWPPVSVNARLWDVGPLPKITYYNWSMSKSSVNRNQVKWEVSNAKRVFRPPPAGLGGECSHRTNCLWLRWTDSCEASPIGHCRSLWGNYSRITSQKCALYEKVLGLKIYFFTVVGKWHREGDRARGSSDPHFGVSRSFCFGVYCWENNRHR